MKKVLIIITCPRLIKTAAAVLLGAAMCTVLLPAVHSLIPKPIQASGALEDEEISSLEKENSRLGGILKHLAPDEEKIVFEDEYRNIYLNAQGAVLPQVDVLPLPEIVRKGMDVNFEVLAYSPGYMRPLYDPDWKGFFFRGWLQIPDKNIDARHRLFIFPFGGSSNFDFSGSQGLSLKFNKDASINYHKKTNFLVYNFNITGVRKLGHQAVLIGEPARTGAQAAAVIQDDLLAEGENKADFLFHMATPAGYELDYCYGHVIRYAHLLKQIEENTVKASETEIDNGFARLEKLLDENLSLKKELSCYVPLEDERITSERCKPYPPDFPLEAPDIKTVRTGGKELAFKVSCRLTGYRRPVYDPRWLENKKRRWAYIPKQVCLSLQKLFIIPYGPEELHDLFGMLGFREEYQPVKEDENAFLIYNFQVSRAVVHSNQLLLIGKPSRSGAEIITITRSSVPEGNYIVRLVTPDDCEVDYTLLYN